MKCDAIWVVDYKKIEVRPLEVPEPLFNEVQIETKACGVCCWDAYQYQGMSGPGPYPYVIGHEATGIVRKVGEGITRLKVGDRVWCAGGSIMEMAQYFNIEEAAVSKIPGEVAEDDYDTFVKYVSEPTVTVQNVLNWANVKAGEHVALIGAGYMGQLTLMGLQVYPWGRLTVFEPNPVRLKMARKYNGVQAYDPHSPEGLEAIEEIVGQGGADNVIEFSACDEGFDLAMKIARRPQSRITVGSWHRHEMKFDGTYFHMGGLILNNVSPSTTFHYLDTIPQTAALIARGVYKPGTLVTHTACYRDCAHVFDRAVDKQDGYIKGVITF